MNPVNAGQTEAELEALRRAVNRVCPSGETSWSETRIAEWTNRTGTSRTDIVDVGGPSEHPIRVARPTLFSRPQLQGGTGLTAAATDKHSVRHPIVWYTIKQGSGFEPQFDLCCEPRRSALPARLLFPGHLIVNNSLFNRDAATKVR